MNAIKIKAAIKANFESNNYDAAYAQCEQQGLFADYLQVKSKQSLASLLAFLRKQATATQEQPEEVEQEAAPAPENVTEDKEQKPGVTYIYFAVSLEDFDNGSVNIEIAIDGLTATTRRTIQRMLNEAGHKSASRWVIAAAVKDGKIIGYGTSKEEAMNARFAA